MFPRANLRKRFELASRDTAIAAGTTDPAVANKYPPGLHPGGLLIRKVLGRRSAVSASERVGSLDELRAGHRWATNRPVSLAHD